jgi:hypothetical protein
VCISRTASAKRVSRKRPLSTSKQSKRLKEKKIDPLSLRETVVKTEIPCQVVTDIRSSYPNMFANVLNSYDPLLLNNFFVNHCSKDVMMINDCAHARKLCLPSRMVFYGVQLLFEFWHGRLLMFPDTAMSIVETQIRTRSDWKFSQVVTKFTIHGTKLYDLDMKDWLPSLEEAKIAAAEKEKEQEREETNSKNSGNDSSVQSNISKFTQRSMEDTSPWPKCLKNVRSDSEKQRNANKALGRQLAGLIPNLNNLSIKSLNDCMKEEPKPQGMNVEGTMTLIIDDQKRIIGSEFRSSSVE